MYTSKGFWLLPSCFVSRMCFPIMAGTLLFLFRSSAIDKQTKNNNHCLEYIFYNIVYKRKGYFIYRASQNLVPGHSFNRITYILWEKKPLPFISDQQLDSGFHFNTFTTSSQIYPPFYICDGENTVSSSVWQRSKGPLQNSYWTWAADKSTKLTAVYSVTYFLTWLLAYITNDSIYPKVIFFCIIGL